MISQNYFLNITVSVFLSRSHKHIFTELYATCMSLAQDNICISNAATITLKVSQLFNEKLFIVMV